MAVQVRVRDWNGSQDDIARRLGAMLASEPGWRLVAAVALGSKGVTQSRPASVNVVVRHYFEREAEG